MKFDKSVHTSMEPFNHMAYKLKQEYLHSACFNASALLLTISCFLFILISPFLL